MGSISHHIMPLVINSLRGGHTHKHTYRRLHRNNFNKPGAPPCGWRVAGLKTDFNFYLEITGPAKTGAAVPFPPALERVKKITGCHLISTQ